MRFSAAMGRKVVGSTAADTVGKVAGFVVDPVHRRVHAVQVKKSGSGSMLAWSNIDAFGEDAVVVHDADAITEPDEATVALMGKAHTLVGKRVLTTAGNAAGTISDVDFDPASGTITALHLDAADVAGARLVGVGSYAVVVDAD